MILLTVICHVCRRKGWMAVFSNEYTYTAHRFKTFLTLIQQGCESTMLVGVSPLQSIIAVYAYETWELRIWHAQQTIDAADRLHSLAKLNYQAADREYQRIRTGPSVQQASAPFDNLLLSTKRNEVTRLNEEVKAQRVIVQTARAHMQKLRRRQFCRWSLPFEQWALANFEPACFSTMDFGSTYWLTLPDCTVGLRCEGWKDPTHVVPRRAGYRFIFDRHDVVASTALCAAAAAIGLFKTKADVRRAFPNPQLSKFINEDAVAAADLHHLVPPFPLSELLLVCILVDLLTLSRTEAVLFR